MIKLIHSSTLQGAGLLIPIATGISILHHPEESAGWAGYTLTIIQFVTQAIYELVMQVGAIDVALVTVERLEECESASNYPFCRANVFPSDSQLPSEVDTKSPMRVTATWPAAGHVQVRALSASYDIDLPHVLHDIEFEILPCERVGMVGRT